MCCMRFSNTRIRSAAGGPRHTSFPVDPGGGKRHRFGGNGDVHPGQQLMDNFYRRSKTTSPRMVDFCRPRRPAPARVGQGGIAPGGHHRHVAGGCRRRRPIPARRASCWYLRQRLGNGLSIGGGDGGRHHHDGARLSDGRRGRSRRTGSPAPGADHQQHNCIQFRGEWHRSGLRLWRPPPAVRDSCRD